MVTAQSKKIIVLLGLLLAPLLAHATPENDRMYALENLSWLKPIDNVDGIFNDFINETYEKYFAQQSRFQIKKIGNTNTVLSEGKIPYYKLAKDPAVLKKIAREFRVESLIRTKIQKEGTSYRFQLEWVYAPRGDVLAQHEFRHFDTGKDEGLTHGDLPQALRKALDELIGKLPFLGQITGVEGEIVTVNMGRNQGVSPKEILVVYSLQALKRHPLEHTIEEWRWMPIGKVQVTQTEESMSFCKVLETEPNQTLDRYQKVREILPPPAEVVKKQEGDETEIDIPRIGWVAGGLGVGVYSREVGSRTSSQARTGGGMVEAGQIEGQLWLNSRWITQISLMTSLMKYNAKDLGGADLNRSYSGNASQVRLAAGYSFIPAKTIFDPAGWVHFGYKSTSYSLTADSSNSVGSSSFGSLFLGLGGEIPIDTRFSAQLGFDLGLIRSFSESDLNWGATGSTSDLTFNLGAAYRYNQRVFFRLMFNINSQSVDFVDGHSISQKLFSLMPSVMYYF